MKNKKVKLYINGIRKKDIYQYMTKWQIFLHRVKTFFKVLVGGIILVAMLVGIFELGAFLKPNVVYKDKEVVLDNLVVKVNELKGQLVSEIQKCESAGYDENDGIITFDGNKNKKVEIPSIGTYQWKKSSIIYYYDTLYQKDITGKEAVLIALDDEKAGQLASDVIFRTDNGLSNWLNCSRKMGSVQKLQVINSLLK